MTVPFSRRGGSLRRLLFLCADNHFASRFCEEWFNSRIRGEGLNWQGISRAWVRRLDARPLESMAPEAVAGLRRRGAAPVNHGRLPLAALPFDFETSQLAIAILTPTERFALEASWPTVADRVECWTPAAPGIPGRLEDLALRVDALVDRLLDAEAGPQSPAADRVGRAFSVKLKREPETAFGSSDGRFDSFNSARG